MVAADIQANFNVFAKSFLPLRISGCASAFIQTIRRDILGLLRIVSDADDIAWILKAYDAQANGLTLCSGSLGANPENDVVDITNMHSDRIHFAHLRNVRKERMARLKKLST